MGKDRLSRREVYFVLLLSSSIMYLLIKIIELASVDIFEIEMIYTFLSIIKFMLLAFMLLIILTIIFSFHHKHYNDQKDDKFKWF